MLTIVTAVTATLVTLAFCGLIAILIRLHQRVNELEKRSPKAHTHRTVAGLEDATAVVIDLIFQVEAEAARLESLRQILGSVRQGPHSYDPDRPSGRRKEHE